MADLEKIFVRWTNPNPESEEPVLIYPQPYDLPPGTRPRIPISHDECSFNGKDSIKQGWVKEDSIPFFDKRRSASIMMSEFITPGGNLQIPPDMPHHEPPREPDRDPFRECTQIVGQTQEGGIGLVCTWSTSSSTSQYYFSKPCGQDIKLCSFSIMPPTILLLLQMPAV